MIRAPLIVLLLALAGCQSGPHQAKCKGRSFALNPNHWQPARHDVKAEAQSITARQCGGKNG